MALLGNTYRDEDNPNNIPARPPGWIGLPPTGWIGNPNPGLPTMPALPDWARPGFKPTTPVLPGGGGQVDRIDAAPAPPPIAPFKPSRPSNPTPTPATPNFNAHPGVIAAQNAEQLGLSELENSLRKAREQLIIRFGDPALAQLAGFGLDPQAGVFARQNYLSGNADLARIDKQRDLRRKAIIDRLAARGVLRSGDLGYLEGENAQQYGNEVEDARRQVLDRLNELMQNYLDRRQALRGGTVSALQGAYQDFLANPDVYLGVYGGQ